METAGNEAANDDYNYEKYDREDLKRKAIEYYHANDVPHKIEEVLNDLFYDQPPDIYGYLVNYFRKHSIPPSISRVVAVAALDNEAQPSIHIEVYCTIEGGEKGNISRYPARRG
ncbi:hypothetical protein Ahia01_000643900 [Argonauta hians]